jgi:hypothetical protein
MVVKALQDIGSPAIESLTAALKNDDALDQYGRWGLSEALKRIESHKG